MEELGKTIMFTTNNLQAGTTIQYQTADQQGIKVQPKIEGQKTHEYPTAGVFYNLNKFQMLAPSQGHASTVNLAQLSDDKIQYIQPIYAGQLMQIAQNGQLAVVNKPMTTVSLLKRFWWIRIQICFILIFRTQSRISVSSVTFAA